MNNIHFIVGMSRSGTRWLTICLNRHSLISAFGETCFFGRLSIQKEILDKEDLKNLKNSFSQFDITNVATDVATKEGGIYTVMCDVIENILKSSEETIKRKILFDRFINQILSIEGKQTAIEKTPHHINHIKDIRQLYPNSKMIVMKRDAEGFMLSYKHQGDRKTEEVKSIFEMIYHPIGCCIVYRKYNNSIENAMKYSNTYLINFPSIKDNPTKLIESVLDFLELPQEDIVTSKQNSSFTNSNKKELELIDRFWLWCFGYGKLKLSLIEGVILPFNILYSLFLLPVWAFRVFNHYRKSMKGNVLRYFWNILKG